MPAHCLRHTRQHQLAAWFCRTFGSLAQANSCRQLSFENPYYFFCNYNAGLLSQSFRGLHSGFRGRCGFRGGFRGDSFSIGILYNKVIDLKKLSDISVLRVVKTEQISFRQHPGTRSCSSTAQVLLLSSEEEERLLKLFAGARYLSRIFSTFAVLSRGFRAVFAEIRLGFSIFP